MLAYVPASARTILDVGCGRGGFGCGLRRQDPTRELWGVEPDQDMAAEAAQYYDKLLVGTFPDLPDGMTQSFDCVVFNDVLEHTVDPWATLRAARPLLSSTGVVVASIPNVRTIAVVLDLVVRGNWTYRDLGVLDRTHLRFFTARSIRSLFADTGFSVERLEGIHAVGESRLVGPPVWRFLLRDFAYTGFAVLGSPVDRP
jgi:2-polyprenyl-3-methyl-5-hydroxy-6-metoxy-1,4-benzoquinol methylase